MRSFARGAVALLVAGCQLDATGHAEAPRACDRAGFHAARVIELPMTVPAAPATDKSAPARFAHAIEIGKRPTDAGTWSDAGPGWSAWRLRLRSDGARSLAVHLEPLALPAGAELWLCSPDGTARQGPYRDRGPSDDGRLWSPPVPGPELWLEILVPASRAGAVDVTVARAFAAFR